jgi:hypothetical protein
MVKLKFNLSTRRFEEFTEEKGEVQNW